MFGPQAAMDARCRLSYTWDPAVAIQRKNSPFLVFLLPRRLETRDGACRQPPLVSGRQACLEGRTPLAGGDALEPEPEQGRLQGAVFANTGRHQGRAEDRRLPGPRSDVGCADADRPAPGLDFALGRIAFARHAGSSVLKTAAPPVAPHFGQNRCLSVY